MPIVRYNAFKAPEQIYVKDKERISFEYDAFESRATMYYGGTAPEKQKRRYVKHYSHDGTFEIKHDRTTGQTQFYIYLGGDAYSAPAVLSVTDDSEKYLYLHRDYLGSITLITDNTGNAIERRHFDAWGNITNYWNAEGRTTITEEGILLDRGYTGHEHLLSVGLIHMNARLYDPVLHRFLQPDNYVQDPFNTQNFNRYGYVLNNPLLYTDPTGEYGEEGLTPNQQRGLAGLIASIGYTVKENWGDIKDWVGRNARSTGKWFEKQGRSVGEWFSKQYNSVKGWFEGDDTPRVVETKPIVINGESVFLYTYNNAPRHTDTFNGGWGQVLHFLTGGIENGAQYNSNGDYIGLAPMGSEGGLLEWVSVGAVKGGLGLVKYANEIAQAQKVAKVGKVVQVSNEGTKLLNQYNSVESLIKGAGKLSRIKGGMQGFVKGDGASVFKALTQNAKIQSNGQYLLSNGVQIGYHYSKTTGAYTIHITPTAGEMIKIRFVK